LCFEKRFIEREKEVNGLLTYCDSEMKIQISY